MPRIEGKTINELIRVEDIRGTEIIPMSVYNDEIGAYVTCGITLDDLFKTIYGMIQTAEDNINTVKNDMTTYVSDLQSEDSRINDELVKTNQTLSYASADLVLLHDHYHRISSYTYENTAYLYDETAYLRDELKSSYDSLYDDITYVATYGGKEGERIDMLTAYAHDNIGILHNQYDDLSAYTYSNIGEIDENIGRMYGAIGKMFTGLAYEQTVNRIQSGYINTIYYENSSDAFNDWSNPDDDNVKPQE